MTHKRTIVAVSLIVLGTLTACRSGGDGSATSLLAAAPKDKGPSVAAPKDKGPFVAAPKVAPEGANGQAHFLFVPVGADEEPKVKVAAKTTATGIPVAVFETKTTGTVKFNHLKLTDIDNAPLDDESEPTAYESATGDIFLVSRNFAGGNAKYGLISILGQSEIAIGSYHSGELTSAAQIPKNVQAAYHGFFRGFGGTVGAEPEVYVGDVRLDANFGAGTVIGQVRNLSALKETDEVVQSYGLAMTGRITGNTYKGTTSFTTTSGAPSGSVSSSAMTGGIYGPNAQETAGALRVEGTPGAAQKPVAIIGAFGGTKPPEVALSVTPKAGPVGANGKGHFLSFSKSVLRTLKVADKTGGDGISIAVTETKTPTSEATSTATVRFNHPALKDIERAPLDYSDADGDFYESGSGIFASLKNTSGGQLSHAQYGTIGIDGGSNITTGGYHSGVLTPASQMPNDLKATYAGSFIGYGGTVGAKAPRSSLHGDVSLDANFGAGTVNGKVSNLQNSFGTSQPYGLATTGRITGNTYKGTTSFTNKSGAPSGTVSSSAMTGGFYGPNAAETAGALRVEGSPDTTKPPVAIVGAFGAKQK